MKNKLMGMFLGACAMGVFSGGLLSVQAAAEENCHSMTEEWFGAEYTEGPVIMEPALGGTKTKGEDFNKILSDYFTEREDDYKEEPDGFGTIRPAASGMNISEQVAEERLLRTEQIGILQEKAGIRITDAKVTALYGEEDIIRNEDGTITMYVYEWTFYDYDDLSDDVAATDVSGYGTYHKITLQEIDGIYQIISDEYNEQDVLGICTMNESTEAELAAMDEKLSLQPETEPEMMEAKGALYSSYNPKKAVDYANKYVYEHASVSGEINYEGYYNSAYYNYNGVGGDCANYVSQSIFAGGMPQVKCEAFGTDGWYYNGANDRSATWTSARQLRKWMGANRGNYVAASDETVYMGSPVFYKNEDGEHATICVGLNSAGTPIINSHNWDRYHIVWNYWEEGTVYTTVQLTADNSLADKAPVGALDAAVGGNDSITVKGWALDTDTPKQAVTVDVHVDGKYIGSCTTDVQREDINQAYGTTGTHGFEKTFRYDVDQAGEHTVTVYFVNTTKGYPAATTGSKKVTVTSHEHAYQAAVVKEAACTELGEKKYTCACGHSYTEVIVSGHQFGPWVVKEAPSANKDGVKEHTCGKCGRVQKAVIKLPKPAVSENPFQDVVPGEFYYNAVLWTFANQMITGYTSDTFAPYDTCTRAQAVTILWRANGSPKPERTEEVFADVPKNAYYYDAVLWAVESGITTGSRGNIFDPEATLTRADFVTFLYRAEGRPACETGISFTDVSEQDYFCDAVSWAAENQITAGYGNNRFMPYEECGRGQVATFIARTYQ